MSRVSENSSTHAVNYSIGKTKSRLEDLQIKGSNLKRIQKPSDDPVGNIELLSIRSEQVDMNQYLRNSNFAKTQLEYTESAIADLTDILSKAKEIAIGQASDIYNGDVRESIAKEVHQLRIQSLAIGNRRFGNRYIFSGHKTLTRPFDEDGKYSGDEGKITLEVNKDFFIPTNMNGSEVFYSSELTNGMRTKNGDSADNYKFTPIQEPSPENQQDEPIAAGRGLASVNEAQSMHNEQNESIFSHLQSLENALLTNNSDLIQGILEKIDSDHSRLVTLRTEVGSLINSIASSENNIENTKLLNETYKSRIEDADVAELFSELSKQQNVLNATYKASSNLMNKSLLDFVR